MREIIVKIKWKGNFNITENDIEIMCSEYNFKNNKKDDDNKIISVEIIKE